MYVNTCAELSWESRPPFGLLQPQLGVLAGSKKTFVSIADAVAGWQAAPSARLETHPLSRINILAVNPIVPISARKLQSARMPAIRLLNVPHHTSPTGMPPPEAAHFLRAGTTNARSNLPLTSSDPLANPKPCMPHSVFNVSDGGGWVLSRRSASCPLRSKVPR